MIVAYAQAADRQGLDAAVDGEVVAPGDARFAAGREKAITLNFATPLHLAGDAEIRYAKGFLRLEFMGAESGSVNLSPIVVVAEVADLVQNRADAVTRAMKSVAAIGRQCDAQTIEAGFAMGENVRRAIRTRRRVVTVTAAALVAVAAVWLTRGCAAPSAPGGLTSCWSR